STSIEEPQSPVSADGDNLVITLSTPETYTFPTSRADVTDIHAGHELRYTAILYKSLGGTSPIGIDGKSTADGEGNRVQRKELLAKNGNQIVFKSVEKGDYFILVFADYIDENAELSGGHYADKYYDTTSSPNYITIKRQEVEKEVLYFNNHNFDFFLNHTIKFTKEENKPQVFNITLTRHVSQVQVIASSSGSIDALNKIKIKNWFVRDKLDLITETSSESKDIPQKNVEIDIANRASNLLFFFYTFNVGENGSMLDVTRFELMPNEGYQFSKKEHTLQNLIRPLPNIIYKVQGNFLSTSEVPSKVVDIKVTTDDKWHDEPQDVTN
ncbi:MAG: hypothetical protein K2J63_06005, partial [Muribaculaceae bacterium]|nr:hypothetical protein [Muribaculaceae bacterium]